MARGKFSPTAVANLKPGEELWDDSVSGLFARGGAKASRFILRYRAPGKKGYRKLAIGSTLGYTVAEAREAAIGFLRMVDRGIDPLDARDAEREEVRRQEEEAAKRLSLKEFYEQKYVPLYAIPHKKSGSVEKDDWLFKNSLLPTFGNTPLADITRADIVAWHVATSKATPTKANRALALLSKMFSFALEMDMIAAHPALKIKKNKEKPRNRPIQPNEVKAIFDAIRTEEELGGKPAPKRKGKSTGRGGKGMKEVESRGITRHAAALFRLLLFTGCRLSEIRNSRWEQSNLKTGWLNLDDSKSGEKSVPLSKQAVAILTELGPKQDGPVIEGKTPGSVFVGAQKAWDRVRTRAGIADFRIHDARHLFATRGSELGYSTALLAATLGHSPKSITEKYLAFAPEVLQAAANDIGEAIDREAQTGATKRRGDSGEAAR